MDNLVNEGCSYTVDWDNDDQPVLMDIGGKPLVSMPYGAGVSDLQAFNRYYYTPDDFERMIKRAFDVLYRESETIRPGRCNLATSDVDRLAPPDRRPRQGAGIHLLTPGRMACHGRGNREPFSGPARNDLRETGSGSVTNHLHSANFVFLFS